MIVHAIQAESLIDIASGKSCLVFQRTVKSADDVVSVTVARPPTH
jgi:hypothetical protein